MKRPYLLWKRGQLWYYKLPEGRRYLSSGQNTRSAAGFAACCYAI